MFDETFGKGGEGNERRPSSNESVFSQRGAKTGFTLNNRHRRTLNHKFFFMKASEMIQGHTHTDTRDKIIDKLQQMNEIDQEVIEAVETL